MFILLLLLLVSYAASFTGPEGPPPGDESNQLRRWMAAVEEILSYVTLGPLKEDFGPPNFASRSRVSVLASQINRFRAYVVRAMLSSLEDRVYINVHHARELLFVSDEAVDVVWAELRQRKFAIRPLSTFAYIIPGLQQQQQRVGEVMVIEVPPPITPPPAAK